MLLRVKLDGFSEMISYEPSDDDYDDFYGYIPDDKEACEDDSSFEDYLEERYSDELLEAARYNVSLNTVLNGDIDYDDYDDTPMNPHCIDARRY